MLLAFHGGGGNAAQFRRSNGLTTVGEREGFIVVHPDGIGPLGLHTWNAGSCCGRASDVGVDDVGFVADLLDELASRTPIDVNRIYATGHSNGGMMSFRLGAEIPDRLAAIAPVGGVRAAGEAGLRAPLPLLHIHSVADPRALYEGGEGPPFPLTNRTVVHPSVETVLADWRERNGCEGSAVTEERRSRPEGTPDAGHEAELLAWRDCSSGAVVLHWRLSGAGHGWPGAPRGTEPREDLIGPWSSVIDTAEEIWRFFENHERGTPESG